MEDWFNTKFDFDFTDTLTPDSERRFVEDPFGFGAFSPQKKNATPSKKDSYVILVMNVPQSDGTVKQTIQEFSHPVDFRAIEDWTDLFDIWFFELLSVPVRDENWNDSGVDDHYPDTTRTLRHTDLKPERCYLVCGYTFDDDDHIPEFNAQEIYKFRIPQRRNTNDIDDVVDFSDLPGLEPSDDNMTGFEPITGDLTTEQVMNVDLFQRITDNTFQKSFFFMAETFFDLQKALMSYYRNNNVIPSEFLPARSSSRFASEFGSMLEGMMTGRLTSKDDYKIKKETEERIHFSMSDINDLDKRLNYLIHVAALEGDEVRMAALLSLPFIEKTFVDDYGRNAVHFAALKGGRKVISELLKHDEFVKLINTPDWKGYTPMRLGVMNKSPLFVRTLTDFMRTQTPPIDLYEVDSKKFPDKDILMFHATNSDCEKENRKSPMVESLLMFPTIKLRGRCQAPPLCVATLNRRIDVMQMLVDRDPSLVNAQAGNMIKGMTPLIMMIVTAKISIMSSQYTFEEKDFLDVLKFLLIRGADIHLKDGQGKTAIDYARENGLDEMLKILLHHMHTNIESGQEGDMGQDKIANVCIQAIDEGDDVLFKKYISALVDPGLPTGILRKSLLHLAVDKGRTKIVRSILAHPRLDGKSNSSSVSVGSRKDLFGRSASYTAKSQGREEIFALLQSKGMVDAKEVDNLDGVCLGHLHPRRKSSVRKSLPLNQQKDNRDDGIGLVRFTMWDKRGNSGNMDVFSGPELDESRMRSSYEEYEEIRQVLPSIFLGQAYPSVVLPTHFSFENPNRMILEYEGLDMPRKLEEKALEDPRMMREMMTSKTAMLKVYLGRIDGIHQLAHIVVILHHLGIHHMNLRPSSILKPRRYQREGRISLVEECFEPITLVNLSNEWIKTTSKVSFEEYRNKKEDLYLRPSLKVTEETPQAHKNFYTKELDELYSFTQLLALTLFHKPVSAIALRRIHCTTSEEDLADMIVEVLGSFFYMVETKITLKHFMHEISNCMKKKPDEMKRRMAEKKTQWEQMARGMGMGDLEDELGGPPVDPVVEKEIMEYERKALQNIIERNQVLYHFTYRENLNPTKFVKLTPIIFEKLAKICEEHGIDDPKLSGQIGELKEFILYCDHQSKLTKKQKNESENLSFSFSKIKDEEVEGEEDAGDDEEVKKSQKLPKSVLIVITKLVSYAKYRGKVELWFPILDILRMLSSVEEFQNEVSKGVAFKIFIKNIMVSKIEDSDDIGAIVNLFGLLCNIMGTKDGRDMLYEPSMIRNIELLVRKTLKHEVTGCFLSAASLLEHLAWSSHMYGPSSIGTAQSLPFLDLIRFCFDMLCSPPKGISNASADEKKKNPKVKLVESVLRSFYTFLKFRHGYKKFVIEYATKKKKVRIVQILQKLELFFVSKSPNLEDKRKAREIIVSLGAMLLPSRAWLRMKARVFRAGTGIVDPFHAEKLPLKKNTPMKKIPQKTDDGYSTRMITGLLDVLTQQSQRSPSTPSIQSPNQQNQSGGDGRRSSGEERRRRNNAFFENNRRRRGGGGGGRDGGFF